MLKNAFVLALCASCNLVHVSKPQTASDSDAARDGRLQQQSEESQKRAQADRDKQKAEAEHEQARRAELQAQNEQDRKAWQEKEDARYAAAQAASKKEHEDAVNGLLSAIQAKCHDPSLLGDLTDTYGALQTQRVQYSSQAGVEDAIATCIKVPASQYKGGDLAQVKKAFSDEAAAEAKQPVVKVFIDEPHWDHQTGVQDGRHYDVSYLHAYVVVGSGARGEVWTLVAKRDHQNGGRINFDTYVPTSIAPIALPLAD